MKYLVVNIGCIECGVSSGIVGLFSSKEQADAIADDCQERLDWRQSGQNHFEVFPLPETDVIAEEYRPPESESAQPQTAPQP